MATLCVRQRAHDRGLINQHARSAPIPDFKVEHWSDGEIFRAIRNGVDADGRWLMIMSYTNAGGLSDDDARAVIAYIRGVPAAGEQTPNPPDQLNLLGVALLRAGMLPSGKPVITSSITALPKGPTFQFGGGCYGPV